ncbi:metallophosphoesterase family protein [Enterococcus sp. AZ109]|uniref:metallophosphoesterase family protein n=1 Tax=Enterococcus sp. AZ109 TaxID=2774634 RepID=UPI003F287B61
MEKDQHALAIKKQSPLLPVGTASALPPQLAARIELYPENRRRPVNKTLFQNEYFQLTYNTRGHSLDISSRGDIVYSAIPYDTARNYVQRAAIQYLLHPKEAREYIESHKATLEKYLGLSILQVTNQKVDKDSIEVRQAYQAIFQNPLFEIQILGRLLQHDETGPLSANLAGKFLFSENVKTGIAEYLAEYLNFVIQLTQFFPVMTDGRGIQLLETEQSAQLLLDNGLSFESDIKPALDLLPQEVNQRIAGSLVASDQLMPLRSKPLLRSEYGKELAEVRKNYVAHSVHPDELGQYFENVHSTENANLVNVVSDIHAREGELPITNTNFNILAGDVSDSRVTNQEIRGIYVIGGHELIDVLPDSSDQEEAQWDKWQAFFKYEWFKELRENPAESWYLLPVGNHPFYEVVTAELATRFPKMNVLNNRSLVQEGIRYIGLTIPVALVQRKKEQQRFILETLQELLGEDQDIPTVIVSHAPLFNELSMLSPDSEAYNKDYNCSEPEIEKLFEEYNILGAIHGHHHIPASSRRFKKTTFAGKQLFVVCSIYSRINTGLDLMSVINPD